MTDKKSVPNIVRIPKSIVKQTVKKSSRKRCRTKTEKALKKKKKKKKRKKFGSSGVIISRYVLYTKRDCIFFIYLSLCDVTFFLGSSRSDLSSTFFFISISAPPLKINYTKSSYITVFTKNFLKFQKTRPLEFWRDRSVMTCRNGPHR